MIEQNKATALIDFSDKKRVDYESIDIVQEARTWKTKKEWKGIFIILYCIQYVYKKTRRNEKYMEYENIRRNKYIQLWPQLFFSLDRPMTKNLICTKHQMSAKIFAVVSFWKEKRTALTLLFSKWNNNRNFSWYLLFSIMFFPMKRKIVL